MTTMNGSVCPHCGKPITPEVVLEAITPEIALEAITGYALARPLSERQAELRVRVAVHLAAHPNASANAVYAAIGGRRQEALRAVRAVRAMDSLGQAGTRTRNRVRSDHRGMSDA